MTTTPPRDSRRRGELDRDSLGEFRDRDLAGKLLYFLKPHWPLLTAGLAMLPLISALSLVKPWLIQLAIDDHFVPGELQGLGTLASFFLAAVVGEFLVRFAQIYVTEMAGQRALRDLRLSVFGHLQRLKTSFFHRNPIGRLMVRLTSDIDSLQEALSSGVVTMIGDFLTLGAIVVILLLKDWKLALVTFAVVPILLGTTAIARRFLRAAFRDARAHIARLNTSLQESVTGMSIIQLFAHEEQSIREYDDVNSAYLKSSLKHVGWDATLYAVVEMISSIAIAMIIWFGAGQTVQDVVTIGVLVAFIEYAQKFFVPVRDLSQKYATIQSAMASAERLFQLLNNDEILDERDDALPITELKHSIEFENVWFAYHEDNWVLKDVSFKILKGEKIAFVGHTGAGKSTINRLLTRLWDVQQGRILIDGVDIREYRLADLRRLFAVVLQDVFLFSGNIHRNITLGDSSVSDSDVDRACDIVGLSRLVARFDQGLEHPVRERGNNLSAGERQLVAFARAVAHSPSILVLDEATANVDSETEAWIQSAVERMLAQQTSIVVAHRLSTIQSVDRIYVMHDGRIEEFGDHAQLIAEDGIYARLVRLNYGSTDVTDT